MIAQRHVSPSKQLEKHFFSPSWGSISNFPLPYSYYDEPYAKKFTATVYDLSTRDLTDRVKVMNLKIYHQFYLNKNS